tara:strand:+ start:527 stop:781 length:255 start_codon:yes stop_codon:yes gene_type:complete
MKLKNLEFRHSEGRSAEIVQWNTTNKGEQFCFTLLFYEHESEGYEIRFVGDRPLQYDDEETMFAMMKYGQTVMDAKWKVEELQK